MPFKSESQRRLFYAKAKKGEISQETLKEWEGATPKSKKLPERIGNMKKSAFFVGFEKASQGISNVGASQQAEAAKAFASPAEKIDAEKGLDELAGRVAQKIKAGA